MLFWLSDANVGRSSDRNELMCSAGAALGAVTLVLHDRFMYGSVFLVASYAGLHFLLFISGYRRAARLCSHHGYRRSCKDRILLTIYATTAISTHPTPLKLSKETYCGKSLICQQKLIYPRDPWNLTRPEPSATTKSRRKKILISRVQYNLAQGQSVPLEPKPSCIQPMAFSLPNG